MVRAVSRRKIVAVALRMFDNKPITDGDMRRLHKILVSLPLFYLSDCQLPGFDLP